MRNDLREEEEKREFMLKRLLHGTATIGAFYGSENDIAVSTVSAQATPLTWPQKPTIVEVPCDHISYFTDDFTIEKIIQVV